MALLGTLASLSQTAASNAADGAVDAPSTIDQQINLLASYAAQLRDGNGFTTGMGNVGQCRLVKSGTNLVLQPFNGNGLTISSVVYKIPSAGVSLAPTALTPDTLYYIYAYMVGNVMTLEAVTTGHATDTTYGVEIKSGDGTRTLVGMARPTTGPAWLDAVNKRFVLSWFNRQPVPTAAAFTAIRGTASATYVEVNTEIRNEFLTWGDGVSLSFDGGVTHNTASGSVNTCLALDGVTSTLEGWSIFQAFGANNLGPVACTATFKTTEGYHYVTVFGACGGGGSASWFFLASFPGNRCTLKGVIQG